ncbi:DeoR/GlpR family DNA-binding transcription regulator [Flavihumibacter rivuli]|uniref:DeoR/GlpR family DNA-binding transcription regulator n=1 Tax=Flavihumibacter rivuli TaxID=2838156 RepID=UPI001BDF0147|nr:DeoR/GlpR family DNA-binding transcription regulator [Flavihumibacter rivuli]ULQ57668.1 DeoR/GlpR family DNA-binding transcription regulator [Flavihumibacter rivuli]
MLKKERQALILKQVNLHNRIFSTQLCEEIRVSEDTIRRDLLELASEGKIIKVHGGALSCSFAINNWNQDEVYSSDKKKTIAAKAAALIEDGMFVLTSGGTTIIELAKALPPDLKATFVCGSLPVLLEYMNHPNIEVIVVGDKLSKSARITSGSQAIEQVRSIKADLCFLGINAIDLAWGLTDNEWEVVLLKKAMVESARKVVGLTISEKINTCQPLSIGPVEDLDYLVTELPPGDALLEPYANKGITII